jgi:hypothetical protein
MATVLQAIEPTFFVMYRSIDTKTGKILLGTLPSPSGERAGLKILLPAPELYAALKRGVVGGVIEHACEVMRPGFAEAWSQVFEGEAMPAMVQVTAYPSEKYPDHVIFQALKPSGVYVEVDKKTRIAWKNIR